jgi:isoleucyl-tRNA synthetase
MRGVVSKELEEARRAKIIGASLEARVQITPANEATRSLLNDYAGHLPSVFIVSECEVGPGAAPSEGIAVEGIAVRVDRARGEKCVRCWNYRSTVGTIAGHPQICDRCAKQLGVSESQAFGSQ